MLALANSKALSLIDMVTCSLQLPLHLCQGDPYLSTSLCSSLCVCQERESEGDVGRDRERDCVCERCQFDIF